MLFNLIASIAAFLFMAFVITLWFENQERRRQRLYNKLTKYRRKPLNITQHQLDRAAKLYADWERKQGGVK